MVNLNLFRIKEALPAANASNEAGAPAYALSPRHQLAQLAATGCLSHTFYAQAEDPLETVLALAAEVDSAYLARTAIYAREAGHMKDMPALLAAVLAVRDVDMLAQVFGRVRQAANHWVRGRRSWCSSGCCPLPKSSAQCGCG